MSDIYCTTYCNHGHDVETGEPVEHECNNLPPAMLEAEMAGDYEKALRILTGKERDDA